MNANPSYFDPRLPQPSGQRRGVHVSALTRWLRTALPTLLAVAATTSAMAAAPGDVLAWGSPFIPEILAIPASVQDRAVAVSAGSDGHALALLADGTVVAWGANSLGGATVPSAIQGQVQAIAAGGGFNVVLKTDATVVAWGNNGNGATNVPTNARTGIKAISAGVYHALALRIDGTVVGWGRWNYNRPAVSVPEGLSNVIAIAVGTERDLALRSDGSVVTWGPNQPLAAAGPTNLQSGVIAIAAGNDHYLALKQDGSVVAWGTDVAGKTQVPAEAQNIIAIAAGATTSVALRADGTAVNWGYGSGGSLLPPPPEATTTLSAIATGCGAVFGVVHKLAPSLTSVPSSVTVEEGHPVALTTSAIGYPQSLQWSRNGVEIPGATAPTLSLGLADAAIAGSYSVVVRNPLGTASNTVPASVTVTPRRPGSAVVWGPNPSVQPVPPSAQQGIVAVASGGSHVLALNSSGAVVAWGDNQAGQTSVPTAATAHVKAIAAGDAHSVALRDDGSVVVWGSTQSGLANVPTAARTGVTAIAAGGAHTLALVEGGKVVAWGNPSFGSTQVPTEALSQVVAIAAAGFCSAALKSDGSVLVWGSTEGYYVPARARDITGIVTAAQHILAWRSDGRVVGWGQGIQAESDVPAEAASGVRELAAGSFFSLGLKENGTWIAWGDHSDSVFPPPAQVTRSIRGIRAGGNYVAGIVDPSPVSVDPLPESVVFDEGSPAFLQAHTSGSPHDFQWYRNGVALTGATGSTLALGPATPGLAGTYDLVISNALSVARLPRPVQVAVTPRVPMAVAVWPAASEEPGPVPDEVLHDIVSCAAGASHFLALKSNGGVFAWGSNDSGESTVPSAAASGIVAVSAGSGHSVALRSNGSVVAWGNDDYGQSSVPESVGTEIIAIAVGQFFTAALRRDGSVVSWGRINIDTRLTPLPGNFSPVTAISGGGKLLALHLDGSVTTWQFQEDGTLAARRVASGGVVSIASGLYYGTLLNSDTSIAVVEAPEIGSLSIPDAVRTGVRAIIAQEGLSWVFQMADGRLLRWRRGVFGLPENVTGTLAKARDGIAFVTAGEAGTMALRPSNLPEIAVAPPGKSVIEGEPLWLHVDATGYPLQFQWYHDGVAIPGATGPVLARGHARTNHVGAYTVDVWNQHGHVPAVPAVRVDVEPAPGGRVVVWSVDGSDELPVPVAARGDVVQIAAGSGHTLALRRDGSVVAWGDNREGQCDVPATARQGIQAVAAGDQFSMALTADGAAVVWGVQLSEGNRVPEGARSGVIRIAAGDYICAAQKDDGTVIVWGGVADPQTGQLPPPISGLGDAVKLSASEDYLRALKADGSIVEWYPGATAPRPLSTARGYVDISEHSHSGFRRAWLTAAGDVETQSFSGGFWGINYGVLQPPTPLRAVVAGETSYLGINEQRSVVDLTDANLLPPPAARSSVIALSAGDQYHVALVSLPAAPPAIVASEQAQSTVLMDGAEVVFHVAASGGQLQYQWRRDGKDLADGPNLSGSHSPDLRVTGSSLADAGVYSVVVFNSLGRVEEVVGRLVQTAPRILAESADAGPWLIPGREVHLRVRTEGGGNEYIWLRNGQPLPNAGTLVEPGTSELTLGTGSVAEGAVYSVEVRNALGRVQNIGFPLRVSPWKPVLSADPWFQTVSVSQDGSSVLSASWTNLQATANQGATWRPVTSFGFNAPIILAQGASGTPWFAASRTTEELPLQSLDHGGSWISLARAANEITRLACSADGSVLVAALRYYEVFGGGPFSFYETHGSVAISIDGGRSWVRNTHPAPASYGPYEAVAVSADGHLIAATVRTSTVDGYSSNGQLLLSEDQGVTWRTAPLPETQKPVLAMSADGQQLLVAGDRQAYRSTDSGITWERVDVPELPWTAACISADGQVVHLASANVGDRRGVILRSADGGRSWADSGAPASDWRSMSNSADGSVLMAASPDGVFAAPGIVKANGPGLSGTVQLTSKWDAPQFESVATLSMPSIGSSQAKDFNADGIPDLIAFAGTSARVWLGTAQGTYEPSTPAPFLVQATGYRSIADLNGDGVPDMISGEYDQPVTVKYGDGTGRFGGDFSLPIAYRRELVVGDFNGDGHPDIAYSVYYEEDVVTVLLGNGSGGFTARMVTSGLKDVPGTGWATFDINGDGHLDLMGGVLYQDRTTVLLGKGDGTFRASEAAPVVGGSDFDSILFTDVNGDGRPDLLRAEPLGDRVHVWITDAQRGFVEVPGSPWYTGPRPYGIATGDVDGDGKTDLIVRSATGQYRVLRGDGHGRFNAESPLTITPAMTESVVGWADLNRDGRIDMIASDQTGLRLNRNRGVATRSVVLIDWQGTPGRAYRIYGSDALIDGDWLFQGWVVADAEGRVSVSTSAESGAQFWKVD